MDFGYFYSCFHKNVCHTLSDKKKFMERVPICLRQVTL